MTSQINLVDPSTYERDGIPHDQLSWLREHAPVFWHEDGGGNGWPGFWAITRHDDVEHISRHPDTFSSHRRLALFNETPEQEIELQRLMMLNMDPPQHTRQRSFVNRGFTPRMIGQLEKHIQEICNELIDDVASRGEADFVRDIAAPLPLYVICELIGAPPQDRDRLFDLSNRLIGYDDPDFQVADGDNVLAATEVYTYANELAERRRARAARRHRHPVARAGRSGRRAHHRGVRPVRPAADRGGQRDDAQRRIGWHARALPQPGVSGNGCGLILHSRIPRPRRSSAG